MKKIAADRNYRLMKVAEEDCSSVHNAAIDEAIAAGESYLNIFDGRPIPRWMEAEDLRFAGELKQALTSHLTALKHGPVGPLPVPIHPGRDELIRTIQKLLPQQQHPAELIPTERATKE